MSELIVIGGGLAGSEAAWQAAKQGVDVLLYEMRPVTQTGVHRSDRLAELVCSNSFGSQLSDRASGLLKEEITCMGSLLIECAQETSLPAGAALAVDREAFAELVTEKITSSPKIHLIRKEIKAIPDGPVVIASGPLTSPALAAEINRITGRDQLYFFDAVAPIVTQESIDMGIAFRASRYQRGDLPDGDYINCPFSRQQYYDFVDELLSAERIELPEFESEIDHGVQAGAARFFEGCLPVEILARRGREALAFGPMRPVGLVDPNIGKRPYAVVQLRQDNLAGSLYNLVGFQTNLKFSEQRRLFRMIPGLENADIIRYGQMHRNTYIFSPGNLHPTLQFKNRPDIYFAGQITGVEGYLGNIATGLLAGWNAARSINSQPQIVLPETTMLGALIKYITEASIQDFQPMKTNFGIMPSMDQTGIRGKRERAKAYSVRAQQDLSQFLESSVEDSGR